MFFMLCFGVTHAIVRARHDTEPWAIVGADPPAGAPRAIHSTEPHSRRSLLTAHIQHPALTAKLHVASVTDIRAHVSRRGRWMVPRGQRVRGHAGAQADVC